MPTRVARVTPLIVEKPGCPRCIGQQTALSPAEVEAARRALARRLVLHRDIGSCALCGTEGPVVSVQPLGEA